MAHLNSSGRQLGQDRPQCQVRLLCDPRQQPFASAGQAVWPAKRCGRRPPIATAAALPVARKRCDHRTTVATLTPNIFAVARRERPPPTDATTRSRKSCE
jgi:hypothetical protein